MGSSTTKPHEIINCNSPSNPKSTNSDNNFSSKPAITDSNNKLKTLNKGCCWCSNNNTASNSMWIIDNNTKNDPIVKLQSFFRGYYFRKQNPRISSFSISNNNIIKQSSVSSITDWSKQIKEVGTNYSTDLQDSNSKIIKLKSLVPKFELDERETYILNTLKLKVTGLLYSDNTIYKGTVNSKNCREGYGKLYLPDGTIYEGFFKNNKMEGRGRMWSIEGFIYEGDYHNSCRNGYGKYIGWNGTIYKGNWINDKQNGIGNETFADKSIYIGEFVDGQRQGKGKFYFADGNYYEGDFSKNKIKGEGTYKWKDGRVFIGDWDNNKMNGYGAFYWPDKKKFYGNYVNNNKEGFGIYIWADGKTFEGFWKEGRRHGYGYTEWNGSKVYGEWYEGKHIKNIKDEIEKSSTQSLIDEVKNGKDFVEFNGKIREYEKEILGK